MGQKTIEEPVKKNGRPKAPKDRLRDFRANWLLDDKQQAVVQHTLRDMSETEGREISSTELLHRLNRTWLVKQARRYKLPLNPPKPTDILPIK